MILVNYTSSPIDIHLGTIILTIPENGGESVDTILSDRDITAIIDSFDPNDIKFKLSGNSAESEQLKRCKVSKEMITNE